jgi:cysteine desulfurase
MNPTVVYFDNNATTRVDDEVLEAMIPFFKEHYGNASSKLHAFGWQAEAAVLQSKEKIAGYLNCEPDELVFTSGATESINYLIKGIFENYTAKGNHIVTCKTEHSAVLDVCAHLETKGAKITYLNVDREGIIDLEELEKAISDKTILVAIMVANNETGVIQDAEAIGRICQEKDTLFFSDATQYVGKMRCDVKELNIHALAFSAHKFHGPKGIGAVYLRRKSPRIMPAAMIQGGGHQNQRRSGTLNVPGIVGMAAAMEVFMRDYWDVNATVSKMKNYFEHQLLEITGLRINGNTRNRLYNTSNITFPEGTELMPFLGKFAFSTGSSCASEAGIPSHVLKNMMISDDEIKRSFRFSFSKYNTLDEIKQFLNLGFGLNNR